jgi:hypothetical protein
LRQPGLALLHFVGRLGVGHLTSLKTFQLVTLALLTSVGFSM